MRPRPLALLAGIIALPGLLVRAERNQPMIVGTTAALEAAVAAANVAGGNRAILLRDGTYTLTETLRIDAPAITLAGLSGARAKVILQGDAMSASARVGDILRVAGKRFHLRDVTLQKCRWHLVQIVGESDADAPVIENCIFRDAYEQMIKVSLDVRHPTVTGDDGRVENCLFEYSAGIGPQFYIGGIDAHGSRRWIVRGNTFRSIISPDNSVAEHAIHFWDGSADTLVEKNVVINCDRGIGFGLDGRGNTGGIIRNNMLYHTAHAGKRADVCISLTESPKTQVYNNSIYLDNDFPWAIEYRFPATRDVLIVNNLANRPVMLRDGASGTIADNFDHADRAWFLDPAAGNLHLTSAIRGVVDSGQIVSGLTNDIDGTKRPQGAGIDLGAHEFLVR